MQIALAEALLRRKELNEKVNVLSRIREADLFEVRAQRKNVTESLDDIVAQVPKMTASQFTREYDWHASALRRIDAAIQRANWNTQIDVDDTVMHAYVEPKE